MKNIKIYFPRDNEDSEYTAVMSGFKPYVIVAVNEKYYRVWIYTLKKLTESYKTIISKSNTYNIMTSGIVLVKKASKKCIIETILSLSNDFFDGLRSKTEEELNNLLSEHKPRYNQLFSEWVQIYPEE